VVSKIFCNFVGQKEQFMAKKNNNKDTGVLTNSENQQLAVSNRDHKTV
jgi:hypothetical protein